MTDKTFVTQQEKADVSVITGTACTHGSSALKALSLTLKAQTIHLLKEPPELRIEHTMSR